MALSKLARAAVCAVLVALGTFAAAPAWPASSGGVAGVAHRGASRSAPENTLSSVVQAVADRADFVEFDVRLTRDGVPVVLHDASLARTTDAESVFPDRSPWRVEDFTLAEVATLDAGAWRSTSYAGERVPTLAQVLGELSRSPSGAYLEVKDPASYGGVSGIGAAVHDLVQEQWPSAWDGSGPARVLVQSADAGFVEAFGAAYPQVPVSLIERSPDPADPFPGFVDDAQVYHGSLTPDLVAQAHASGLTVGAWTVNDSDAMTQLATEVDSITTNDPAMLRRVLSAHGWVYAATEWPAVQSDPPTWSVRAFGRYLRERVRVEARLVAADGSPAPWQWAMVQRRADGAWRTLARRATDAEGRFTLTVPGTRDLRLRVASSSGGAYPVVVSPPQDVTLSMMDTALGLTGPAWVRPRRAATLAVHWQTAEGVPLSGTARLFRRRSDGSWRYLRDLDVADGYCRTRVHPGRRTQHYRVRTGPTWWRTGAGDSLRVRVMG